MSTRKNFHAGLAIVLLAVVLQACASAPPDAHLVPDEPGLYAIRANQLERLDGDSAFETQTWPQRSMLPTDVEFVVFQQGANLASIAEDAVQLTRVGWVRSRITPQGDIMPNTGSRWGVPELEAFQVPMTYGIVAGRADVIRVTPQFALDAGLYELRFRGLGDRRSARLGVDWQVLDQDVYAAAHCVDAYAAGDGAHQLLPCEQQHDLLAGRGLLVELVDPVRQVEDGVTTLIIQGFVRSTANRARTIPPLTAELRDGNGQVLASWEFTLSATEIAPGESINFQTRAISPPEATETVHVRLNAATTS
jgi:hypothetical protein